MVVGWMSLGGGGPLGCLVLHALGYYTLPPLPLLPPQAVGLGFILQWMVLVPPGRGGPVGCMPEGGGGMG